MLRDALVAQFPELVHLSPGALAIGGAVRDLFLDLVPVDVDVETDAPLAAASSLGKVITLGRGELTVYRVVVDGRVYDFSGKTDLGRRDFTINAIAIDLTSGEIRDPHGGQEDIRRRVVRMIAPENFDDDPLRMLRGVRLAVRFDFTIDEATVAAIRQRAGKITTVAAERVTYELHATFSAGRFRKALGLLNATGLDQSLFGFEVNPNRFPDADISLAASYALVLRNPKEFGERWKWSDALLRDVQTLQQLLRDPNPIALYDAGEKLARQLPLKVPMPDFTIKPLLDGHEIGSLTGLEGPKLGALKRALLEAQIRGEVRTRNDAQRFLNDHLP